MAPTTKVSYFNIIGIAEPIRMLLAYGGIDFEDYRVQRKDWPELKPNTPFGQVPVYEENGKVSNQSISIARYVAKKVKLVGKTDWENLEIDSVADTINDLRLKIALYGYEKDAAVKKSIGESLFNETVPFYLGRLDKIAQANNGHLATGKLTWADIYFVALLDYMNLMAGTNLIEKYANLNAVRDKVLAIPAIENWVKNRPESDT